MPDVEQFIVDGHIVSTGLRMPTAEDNRLMATMETFPEDWIWDPKDIEKALVINGSQRYMLDRKKRAFRMRNQSALGKCNGSANASGFEQIREIQGMAHVPLADCYTYIGCNGGKDQGSGLPTTFTYAQTNGFSPYLLQCGGITKTFPNDAYNARQVPADVMAQAKIESRRFMGVRLSKIPLGNFQLFCQVTATAIARRLPVVWAWQVGGPGSRLNNGYMQVSKGMGNHANLLHSGKWVGGKNLVDPDNENSWGPTADPLYGPPGPAWGENGFGLCTMEDAYACAHIHPPYIMISASADVADGTYKQ